MASVQRDPKVGKGKGGQVKWLVRWHQKGYKNPRSVTFYKEAPAKVYCGLVEANGNVKPAGTLDRRTGKVVGEAEPQAGRAPTYGEVLTEYLEAIDVQDFVRGNYGRQAVLHVTPLLGDKPVDGITPADAQAVVNKMRAAGYAAATIASMQHTILKPVIDFAYERGYRGHTEGFRSAPALRNRRRNGAATGIRLPRHRGRAVGDNMVLMPAEYPVFIRAAYSVSPLAGDLADAFYLSGLRWQEMAALRAGAVDAAGTDPALWVRAAVKLDKKARPYIDEGRGKTDHAFRRVDLSAKGGALFARLADGKAPYDLLFTRPDGSMLRNSHCTGRLWPPVLAAAAALGLTKHITFRGLRHGYATAMIDGGADWDYLARQLGHSTPEVTRAVYVHLTPRRVQAGRAAVDRAVKQAARQVRPLRAV